MSHEKDKFAAEAKTTQPAAREESRRSLLKAVLKMPGEREKYSNTYNAVHPCGQMSSAREKRQIL